jgi:paired amphipathic helix protein Sin3a
VQIHNINSDQKCQDLVALLERDRAQEQTTIRQQIAYRMEAETVTGQDDSLFRIEWVRFSFSSCLDKSIHLN